MSLYRSIDTAWEEDEIVYYNNGHHCFKYKLILNGQKKILITFYTLADYVVSEYLNYIKFTGMAYTSYCNSDYMAFKYIMQNGLLHCEDGPAKTWMPREVSSCIHHSYYKRGKPWLCWVKNGIRSNSSYE
jgi:hypothetical protein